MKRVALPGIGLSVSRFIFGTAGLFNIGDSKTRRSQLEAAADAGFTHFDTAPYYGFGMAERDLRPVLAARPHLTVATKVGLYPPGDADAPAGAILARKIAGRVFPPLSKPLVDWSIDRARRSLEGSLRRLGRERIDLFLLHEPRYDLLPIDEWRRWLEAEVLSARVGHFGLALEANRLGPFLDSESSLSQIVQVNDSLDLREADVMTHRGRPLQITYGYLSSLKRRGVSLDASRILASALMRNATGAIIVFTSRQERLRQYTDLVGE